MKLVICITTNKYCRFTRKSLGRLNLLLFYFTILLYHPPYIVSTVIHKKCYLIYINHNFHPARAPKSAKKLPPFQNSGNTQDNIPSKDSSKNSQSLESVSKLGSQTPFSHALTVRWSTPIISASRACVIPAPCRSCFKFSANFILLIRLVYQNYW